MTSNRASYLRLTAVLTVPLAVVWAQTTIGGTGGVSPGGMEEAGRAGAGLRLGLFLPRPFHPLYVVPGAAVLGTILARGWAATESAIIFAVGSNDRGHVHKAAQFWSLAARATSWTGILGGAAATVMIATVCYRMKRGLAPEPTSDFIRNTWWWTTHAPFAGLFVGRLMFGALAQAARNRDDRPAPPLFSPAHDVLQLGIFLVPWYAFLTIMEPYP